MTAWLLLPVLRQWRSRRPDVHLELSEFSSIDVMVELLEAGRTDVVFAQDPRTPMHALRSSARRSSWWWQRPGILLLH
jgi:DNA-binding transcriptional LysR family regulator